MTSSLRVRNLNISSKQTKDVFNVTGKMFVDENVTVSGFNRFINIEKGGYVEWNTSNVASVKSEVIYINGGKVLIKNNFSGKLTNGGELIFGGSNFRGTITHKKGGVVKINSRLNYGSTATIPITICYRNDSWRISKIFKQNIAFPAARITFCGGGKFCFLVHPLPRNESPSGKTKK